MGNVETVKYGGATVRLAQRSDGRWHLRWRLGGREKTTTAKDHAAALARARQIAKDLSRSTGSRVVAQVEAVVIDQVAELATREGLSPAAWIGRAESIIALAGGSWINVERAVRHWDAIGLDKVEHVTMATAIDRFLEIYENHRAAHTLKGVRKEVNAWLDAGRGQMGCLEVTQQLMTEWINRGDTAPAPRYFNNRLGTWTTFWNRCREWGYWPAGERTPVADIEKRREADRAPEILTPKQAWDALLLLKCEAPELVWHFALGCWAGLRPMELHRLRWEHLQWEQGYIQVPSEVAGKTLRERFVPLEEPVLQLLDWPRPIRKGGRGAVKVCGYKDSTRIPAILKADGILDRWQQDVMRHSYISYRIARGDSLARIAEEAGNSEGVIRRRYRRPVKKEEGTAYFTPP